MKVESIKTIYAQNLEKIKFDNELAKVRTSFFLDHQRLSYASILELISEIFDEWAKGMDYENDNFVSAPRDSYSKLQKMYYKTNLYLDEECALLIVLLQEAIIHSMPYDVNDEKVLDQDRCRAAFDRFQFFFERGVFLFREKIGLNSTANSMNDIAILGGIILINRYHFSEIELPHKGVFSIRRHSVKELVKIGNIHIQELINELRKFKTYLERDPQYEVFFNSAYLELVIYLKVLDK